MGSSYLLFSLFFFANTYSKNISSEPPLHSVQPQYSEAKKHAEAMQALKNFDVLLTPPSPPPTMKSTKRRMPNITQLKRNAR